MPSLVGWSVLSVHLLFALLLQVKRSVCSVKNISWYRHFSALEATPRRKYLFPHSLPYSVEEKDAAVEVKWEALSFWFEWLEPVMEEKCVPLPYCAVSMIGVPLNCWSFIIKIKVESSDDFFPQLDDGDEEDGSGGGTVDPWEESSSEGSKGDDRGGLQGQLNIQPMSESLNRAVEWVRGTSQGSGSLNNGNLKNKVEGNESFNVDIGSEGTELGEGYSNQKMSGVFSKGRKRVSSLAEDTSGQDKVVQDDGLISIKGGLQVFGPEQESPISNTNGTKTAVSKKDTQEEFGIQIGYVSLTQRRPSGRSASVSKADRGFYNKVYARRWDVKSCGGKDADYDSENEKQGVAEALECWNVSKLKVKARAIRRFVEEKIPIFLFLQESKLEKVSSLLVRKIGGKILTGSVVVPTVGSAGGGLITLWNQKVECPVCLGGDFNAILTQEEKRGGVVNSVSMSLFRDFVSRANLIDLPLVEGQFTWCNNRETTTFERLDQFLVDQKYFSYFPKMSQILQPRSVSDNNIIVLENKECNWGPKPFRLFNYMLEEEGFSEMVKKELLKFGTKEEALSISKILNRVKDEAKKWSNKGYLQLPGQIRLLERKLFRKWKWICNKGFPGEGQCSSLEKPFTEEEVWEVIVHADSNKAPGSDGLNLGFFKKFWNFLKEDVMLFFRLNSFSFRGRNILDCSFIANESIDYWRKKGLKGVVFKVDFKRAYDSVDWSILLQVMSKMGFGDKWRGLRHGCSLSPLLFNLAAELLHLLLTKAVEMGLFSGFDLGVQDRAFKLSHLQFTDDLIIFSKDSTRDLRNVRRVLLIYELLVGLKLNLVKSMIYGINVEDGELATWANDIGCSVGYLPSDYLGLPLGHRRNSASMWEPIVARFNAKLSGWMANSLSLAGRVVLVKSVLCSLPVYFLSIFRILASVLLKLNSIMAAFLWGGSADKKKIHWVNWKLVTKSKKLGGLGIPNLSLLNRALLGKWVWKFASEKRSWRKRVVCGFYNLDSNSIMMGNSWTGRASWIWKGVVKNFFNNDGFGDCVRRNMRLKTGNGVVVEFWNDVWLGEVLLKVLFPRLFVLSNNKEGKAMEFGENNDSGWVWDIQLRRNLAEWEFEQWFEDVVIPLDSLVGDLKLADSREKKRQDCSQSSCWVPPPDGFLKLNVDGAMVSGWDKGGIGGLVRDTKGVLLQWFSEPVGGGPPIMAELLVDQESGLMPPFVFILGFGVKSYVLHLEFQRERESSRRLLCSVATESSPKQVKESEMDAPKEIFLKDYKSPAYYFDTVDLKFSLGEEKTIVASKITVFPSVEGSSSPLVLDGEDLKLISIKVDGKELKEGDYHLDSRHLTLPSPPQGKFTLQIDTEIQPQKNTSLEGLYKSSGNFCTQCEAEGFRKITFYQDRPDIMAKYTCRIEADKSLYPVLLSNGNLIEQGDLEASFTSYGSLLCLMGLLFIVIFLDTLQGGKHYAVWEDPFKKPCYLFALVAGQLESRDDIFVTRSGRKVSLRIWTPAQDVPKTAHAMHSLKAAMKWDEDVFGLEYDLDLFNIVAVPDFNMGAMENKSLNIFNSKLVLASPETASDADYAAILGVIGHEYFHNWTGNRVTCRDWFQLSLKEGLTVFRDQEFSSDMGSRTVKRIADVSKLRNYQFPQDAGPMAHPVRPHSYIKGAEVVRMYKTLLGTQGFRKGMDLYFKRHDGQAVTCEDFFAAMRDANGANFANFLLWYSQAGTPVVKVSSSYNAEARTFSLKFSQEVPPTPGQPVKEPMFIPLDVGLLDSSGKDMPLSSVYHDGTLQSVAGDNQPVFNTVLRITKKEEEFVFCDIFERPIPSLLRGYSAPVRLESDLSDSDLFFLLAHDSDEFNRWEAGQLLARKLMLSLVSDFQKNKSLTLNPKFVQGLKSILCDTGLDKEFIAKAITLPGEGEIMDMMEVADPDAVHAVRTFIRKELASQLKPEFLSTFQNNRSSEEYTLTILIWLDCSQEYCYCIPHNMTDQFAALAAIAQNPENVRNLLNHPAFDLRNPNKVYSLIGGFRGSPVNFHAKDGKYTFNHPNMARRALKNTAIAYLASLEDPEITELVLREYNTATNMTDQFAALAAIAQNPGKTRDDVLADFYSKWQHDYLVVNKWFALQAMSDIPGNVENVRNLLNHPAFDLRNPNKVYSLIGGFRGSPVNFHAKDGWPRAWCQPFSRWKRFDENRQKLAKQQLEMIMSANGLSENVFEIASKSLA
ncbi:Puromycin-sensitive aminopeptidase [Hibiscus syriacus]|uniref:Puromycin-sensitive aminopeptidase n=5 Tax=Magnoliopsida TaxID=3398 RepID=A0A6A2YF80_HIBSY|nr:Puromycin-sensitive aminopeptidase [Hibiscus syriacus]